MNCTYCGTRNTEEDHRCRRCGRRLHAAVATPAPRPYPAATRAAVAPDLAARQAIPYEVARAAIDAPPALAPRQRTLFPSQVLRFEDFAPREEPARRGAEAPPPLTRRMDSPVRRRPASRKRERLEAAGQQRLDFEPVARRANAEPAKSVQPARYCSHPVAMPVHRVIAAALDVSLLLIALGVFAAMFLLLGGSLAFTSATSPLFGAAAAGIVLLYNGIFWLADGDTPGTAWCRLRLLDFDGQRPTRTQRMQRFAGTLLSLATAGLGLFWALGDQEKLAWNDYISRTFPTPVDAMEPAE